MENNGRGIFYGVIGVATLIVAIIGATFAYFSASATNNTDVTGQTAEAGGVGLEITDITKTGANMIPLNVIKNASGEDVVQFSDAITGKCKDSKGNNVCNIYSIKVTNQSTQSTIQVRGTLNLASEATNMKWKLLTDDTTTTEADFSTNVAAGTVGDITVGGNTGGTGKTAASKTLAASASDTYYVMVWLEETGAAQEGTDAGKAYTGTVTFNAVDNTGNSSGLTATFGA